MIVFSEHEDLDKSISLDALETDSGIEQMDKALCKYGERFWEKSCFLPFY